VTGITTVVEGELFVHKELWRVSAVRAARMRRDPPQDREESTALFETSQSPVVVDGGRGQRVAGGAGKRRWVVAPAKAMLLRIAETVVYNFLAPSI
jgi:hypothetical protein